MLIITEPAVPHSVAHAAPAEPSFWAMLRVAAGMVLVLGVVSLLVS